MMRLRWSILALLTAISCAARPVRLLAGELAQGATVEVKHDFSLQPVPRFQNGMLLAYNFDQSIVWSFDRTGTMLTETRLAANADAFNLRIRDIAGAADGTIAVTGSATDTSGRTAPVICWIVKGALARVVRTYPFSATRIAFAADGTLWGAGYEFVYTPSNPVETQIQGVADYDVLRHYDAQGKLADSGLRRSTFAASVNDPAQNSHLAVVGDRVGFIAQDFSEYVEVSEAKGVVTGRWKLTFPVAARYLTGISLAPSGDLYLGFRPSPDPSGAWPTMPVYRLDRAIGSLQPVALTTVASGLRPTLVVGSDGDQIVMYGHLPTGISWFSVH